MHQTWSAQGTVVKLMFRKLNATQRCRPQQPRVRLLSKAAIIALPRRNRLNDGVQFEELLLVKANRPSVQ